MFTLLDQTALDVSQRCCWSRQEEESESGSYHYSSLNFTPASCVSERTDHKIILLVYDVQNVWRRLMHFLSLLITSPGPQVVWDISAFRLQTQR